jgi:hypothetical protein
VICGGGDALQCITEGVEIDALEVVEQVAVEADVMGGRGLVVAL